MDRNRKLPEFKIFYLGKRKGKILKPLKRHSDYSAVKICINGREEYCDVHRLMMEAFVPNPNNLPCVNHKDENKSNNYIHINPDGTVNPELSNLEWCDYKYNTNWGTAIDRRRKKLSKPVYQYTVDGKLIKKYPSQHEASRQTGINVSRINDCCSGKRLTAGGFKWSND